jgi:transmembrane sensor
VHVLGTRFNVKSYPEDSATYTTLLEGVVKMNEAYSEVLLKPGEQALLDQAMHQPIRILKNIDTERIIAWKNGKFDFEDKSLKEIMRELARWYDLKIVYSPGLDNAEFGGDIPMNLNLSQVLKVLEGADIHFKMGNDKTLRVTP